MKKRILGLAVAATAIIGLVASGTLAQFTDTETTGNNTFTAGTLNLQVGAADPCTETIAIGDDEELSPGTTGNAGTWATQNTGSIAGDLSISIGAITNNENTILDPEADEDDTTDDPNGGELGGLLKVAFWLDMDQDGQWDGGDKYLTVTPGVVTSAGPADQPLPAAAYDYLDSFSGKVYTKATVGVNIGATSTMGDFRVEYDFPDVDSSDNVAQSDDCVFTITFDLEQ